MKTKKLDPVHPGEILQKEFLEPTGGQPEQTCPGIGSPRKANQ